MTVAGDKGFDTADFVRECRNLWVTPGRRRKTLGLAAGSAIDRRTAAARGLCDQSEEEEAHRRMFWLAEDDCADAQSAASRDAEGRLDLYVRVRGLQSWCACGTRCTA